MCMVTGESKTLVRVIIFGIIKEIHLMQYTELRVNEVMQKQLLIGDFTSNGFKIRQTDSALNQNGATYVYFAFAESPFKNARAR